jgi:hypothetical protein
LSEKSRGSRQVSGLPEGTWAVDVLTAQGQLLQHLEFLVMAHDSAANLESDVESAFTSKQLTNADPHLELESILKPAMEATPELNPPKP